ncbi:rap1 GTPase-GDP dissociation stimulator 1-like isoform X2 [Falco rusticolus]|uniref:rap1 GTPase-GDP dissociation stimulator 1-like isoform X2 n=1 Tax=Falco peregrinus TaxID=8954 RepID=UPI000FFC80FF|nr:rap1 GTPase-GDP dissociation stimulator 1-like isoform X2 [Falco peregrinus]XP_037255307.1 rap1 GTPase-GDP dissociation stimulator 1-like isoform X2 [Falco rusticolus]
METLSQHLEYLGLCGDDPKAEDQILESLNRILLALTEDKQRSLSLLRESGIFLTLAKILKGNPRCAVKAAQVLSEIAKNEEMKKPCIEADLVPVLIPLLESTDQEMLLHAGRAIGRICYDNRDLQEELVKAGVTTSLVRILTDYADSEPLVHVDLLALCNLADLDGNCVRMVQLGVIDQLLDLLEKHVESGDISVQHAALSALRNLAIPVVNKVQVLEEGVAERIQVLLRSEVPPVQLKLLGTLRMLADGQADAAEILGQDPMLLNRLVQWCDANDHTGIHGEANRLLASIMHHNRSQEVVRAIQEAQGVKHLVSMTTSKHAAMQNEALNALAIASAIDLETLEESFKESQLVQSLHKLLQDDNTSPEVKYNSMGLLCSLLNSGDLRQEIEEDKIKETLEQLCSHSNANVVKEAVTTLQVLRGETPH